jgi:hypothetical protein
MKSEAESKPLSWRGWTCGNRSRAYLRFVGLAEEGVGEGAEWIGGGRPVRGAVVLAGDEVARPHLRRRVPPAPEGGAGTAPIAGDGRRSDRGDGEKSCCGGLAGVGRSKLLDPIRHD